MDPEQIRRGLAELDGITGDDWLIRGDELANANCKAIRRDQLPAGTREAVDRWVTAHRGRLVSHREPSDGRTTPRLRIYYEVPLKELWPPRAGPK